MISWLHLAIALVPVGMYLIMLGAFKLRNRPLLTTGWRDALALGIAVSGLVVIGPMELFFPREAASLWHGWVWCALAMLYFLILTLVLIGCRPRLLAYGMDSQQFLNLLLDAAREVDPGAFWQGDVLTLPTAKLQLAIEPTGAARVQQVVSVGRLSNFVGWLELERAYVQRGAGMSCTRSKSGVLMIALGLILMAVAISPLVASPNDAVVQFRDFFDR